MHTTPLHTDFGVEVHDLPLKSVTADSNYRELRGLFERHPLLLFRNQPLSDSEHIWLAQLFGPMENRTEDPGDRVSPVPNKRENGAISDAEDIHTLNLIAN